METQSAGSVDNEDLPSVHSGTLPGLNEPAASVVERKTAVCSSQLRPGFESVSPELIRTILTHLKAPERGLMAQVCAVWKAVADEPWIWTDDHAELQAEDISTTVIDSLVRRGICRVKLASTANELRELPQLLKALPGIISLDVSGCCNLSIPVLEMSFVTHRFDSLTTLNLNRCQKVSDGLIHTVTIQAPNLQALHLDGCRDVRDLAIHYLSVKLVSMKLLSLKLCRVSNLGLRELAGLKEPGGPIVSPGLQQLRYLGLQRNGTIDDNGLSYIHQGLRHLVTLNLRMCFNVTDDGIRHVAGVETLRSLVLYRCKNLTAASIQHLAARTSSLRHLDIGCCTNIDDSALLSTSCGPGLVGLVSLKMMANPITDRGLSALSNALVNLEFLDVSDCKRITKNGIALMSGRLPKLRHMKMRFCTSLKRGTIRQLVAIPSLEIVDMEGCNGITGRGTAFMARGQAHANIIDLNISYTSIGDTGLRYISMGMPNLRRLSIRGCLVSDKGISRIVSALPGLNVLRIARCAFLTDRSLHSIGSNLRCLQHIDIDGCPKITEAGRKHLLNKLPHVRFLNEG